MYQITLKMSLLSDQIAAVGAELGTAVVPRVYGQSFDEILPEINLPDIQAYVGTQPSAFTAC